MKSIKFYIVILIGLAWFSDSAAQVGINKLAQSTMNFQLVSISARASALGEAYYTLGTGAESMFYNPAGLAETAQTYDVALNYTQWIADIAYLGGAAAYNLNEYGTVGLSVLSVDYGTIHGTQLDPSKSSPTGYIETGDVSGVGAYSFGVSYAKAISDKFAIGGTMRYVTQNLGSNSFSDGTSRDNKASKLVFDAGVKYRTGFKGFSFGMAIRNFASNLKREAIDEQLPIAFTMGGAINLMEFISEDKDQSLMLAVDFLHSNSYSERTNVGVEYNFMGMLALRAGYQSNRNIASWSAGAGFNTSLSGYDVQVNYSFSKMEIFDNVNRVSVNFAF
jgi:hypothetical protein